MEMRGLRIRLAIFSAEDEVRNAAVEALKVRRERDYTTLVLSGLRYPYPAVAKRASEALVDQLRELRIAVAAPPAVGGPSDLRAAKRLGGGIVARRMRHFHVPSAGADCRRH